MVLGILGSAPSPLTARQVPGLIDPGTPHPTYDLVESLTLRRGTSAASFLSTKPWSSRDLGTFLVTIDSTVEGSGSERALVRLLRESVRHSYGRAASHAGVAGVRHLMTVEPRLNLFAAAGEYELDPGFLGVREREVAGDPDLAAGGELRLGYAWFPGGLSLVTTIRGRSDTRNAFDYRERDPDGAVDVRSAYALWQNRRFMVAAGRVPVEWGNGPLGGVGLTAVGPSLDGFLARGRFGIAQVSVLSAFLSDERANRARTEAGNTITSSTPETDAPPGVDRYFHAHRLDLNFGDSFTIGVNEMAVVTGIGRRADLRYLTGLVPYVVVQNSRDEIDVTDVNLGGGFQYRWRLPWRVLLYGEYFANEVFLDTDLVEVARGIAGRRSNTQGFQQGIRWAAPFGLERFDLEAEIVRLEPFVYLHRGLNTNWERNDVPLGAPLGPDNHRALARLVYYRPFASTPLGSGLLRVRAGVTWRDRGRLRIASDRDIQGEGPTASIPSEPVETSWLLTLGAEAWWPRRGGAGVRITTGRVDDVDHIPGAEITPFDLEAYLSVGPAWDFLF